MFMSSNIQLLSISELRSRPNNARTHSKKQIRKIAESIRRFGFVSPLLIDEQNLIIAGHGRFEAAKLLGMSILPVMRIDHLSPEEVRALVLADNRLALDAGWDREVLAGELQALIDINFDVELTGFNLAEIDLVIDTAQAARPEGPDEADDRVPPIGEEAICRTGNVWRLGRHRLICGDARDHEAYAALLGEERVDLIFTDPPFNVPVQGHVCGLGKTQHREFAMAAGEMTPAEFEEFLKVTLGAAAQRCRDGAIAFVCMDWRHISELLSAGSAVFSEMKNLIVWNKLHGGLGSFYRSQHELIFVFKVGSGEHVNTFGLGADGRYRTNVWDHRGANSFGKNRDAELAMHPTVKPVALIADALRDCSRRGGIILDQFGGSGSTLIAAEKVGRQARLIEFDPIYCDTIIRRWQDYTGKAAQLVPDGECFDHRECHHLPRSQ